MIIFQGTLFLEVSCDLPLYKSREALKSLQNLSVLNEGIGKSISPQNVFHILFGMGMVLRPKFLKKLLFQLHVLQDNRTIGPENIKL